MFRCQQRELSCGANKRIMIVSDSINEEVRASAYQYKHLWVNAWSEWFFLTICYKQRLERSGEILVNTYMLRCEALPNVTLVSNKSWPLVEERECHRDVNGYPILILNRLKLATIPKPIECDRLTWKVPMAQRDNLKVVAKTPQAPDSVTKVDDALSYNDDDVTLRRSRIA
jgi:hypothetical protein